MPWVDVGRFTFDLACVVLVERGVTTASDGTNSVTIRLEKGIVFDLSGEDAQVFLNLFAEYKASRKFGRPPPTVVEPEESLGGSNPGEADRGNLGGFLALHPAGDQ